MKLLCSLPCLLLLLTACVANPSLEERARILHASAIVVDTHEDLPEELEEHWADIGVRHRSGHIDIPRWREGGMTGAMLAAYVKGAYAKSDTSARKAMEFIDLIHRLAEQHPRDLVFADSVRGIRAAKSNGKIAVLIGIEGGHAIEDSLGALSAYHRLGVRYLTLTHTNTNHWADSSGSFWNADFDPKTYQEHHGLTTFGEEVVLEMNRLGMLVDVSHASEETIDDVLRVSKAPVFASHSSCRALSNIPRNLTDDQIRAITKKGGVIMINIGTQFIDQKSVDIYVAARAALAPKLAEIRERLANDEAARNAELDALLDTIKYPMADYRQVADHFEHVMRVGGTHSVGLGTDFDGIDDVPEGLEDVSKLPRLTEELLRRGHSDDVIRGILGENFLAFWDRAEAAKRKAPARTGPLPFSKP